MLYSKNFFLSFQSFKQTTFWLKVCFSNLCSAVEFPVDVFHPSSLLFHEGHTIAASLSIKPQRTEGGRFDEGYGKWMFPVEWDQRGKHSKLSATVLSVSPNMHPSSCIIYVTHLPCSVSVPFFISLSQAVTHTDLKRDGEPTLYLLSLSCSFLDCIALEKFGWNGNHSS